jgi:cytochrome c553
VKGAIKAGAVVLGVAAWGLVSGARGLLSPRGEAPAAGEQRAALFGVPVRNWLLMAAAVIAAAGVAGLLIVVSGVVPIKASSGHWAITEWFLNFSMARSVGTHSAGIAAPELGDAALVLKGAGHFETGCRPCHGSPEHPQPRIAQAMTPRPPYLSPVLGQWSPAELFYIVKHGVKLTGMPAWPAQGRDDEVWAMVAFLVRMRDLGPAEYRKLVGGPDSPQRGAAPMEDLQEIGNTPRAVIENCGRCHGADGLGRGSGAFPKLAGQRPAYLQAAMEAYARGDRHSGIMEPVAGALRAPEIGELAAYYSGLPKPPGPAMSLERGESIARNGIPAQRVPACAQCHGPGAGPRNPHYPALAGQYAEYLELQLQLFKSGQRGGSAYAHLMHEVAPRMSQEQMRAAAQYYASISEPVQ